MKMHLSGLFVTTLFALTACGTTPIPIYEAGNSPPTSLPVAQATESQDSADIHRSTEIQGASGLGTFVYTGRPLAECPPIVRTGSRIPRPICIADGYNGMFPSGGINMGTAKESQIPYGSH